DFDDPRADDRLRVRCRVLDRLDLLEKVVRLDDVGIELDLEGRVGGADLGDAPDPRILHRGRRRKALEESLERHAVVAFDEQMLIATERVTVLHQAPSLLAWPAANRVASQPSSHRVWID